MASVKREGTVNADLDRRLRQVLALPHTSILDANLAACALVGRRKEPALGKRALLIWRINQRACASLRVGRLPNECAGLPVQWRAVGA